LYGHLGGSTARSVDGGAVLRRELGSEEGAVWVEKSVPMLISGETDRLDAVLTERILSTTEQ